MSKQTRAAGVLILLCVAVCLLTQGRAAAERHVTAHVLENGLQVLILEKRTVPVVAVQVWYRVGSRHDPEERRGIAHLFEHMMFRGSEKYGPEEHARLINDVGGSSNAYTFFDMTVYHERLPSSELELALELEADRMDRLALTQETLDTEREVVKEEFRGYADDPFFEVLSQALEILYPNHPYGLTPLGRMADLEALSLDDCQAFYESRYAPNNAVLVIVGDTDAANALTLCEKHFGGMTSNRTASPGDLALEPREEIGPHKLRAAIPVRATALAFYVPEANHADTAPLRVLAHILWDGESSRLHTRLVRDRELAVAVLGHHQVVQGPGVFACGAAHLPNISSRKVARALVQELGRLKKEDVTDGELEKARKQLLAAKVFERYTAEGLADGLGFAEVVEGDYRCFEDELDDFRRVNKADIRRVANEYFTDANRVVFFVRPKRSNPLIWLYGVIRSLF
ncbi:MAG TPA: insulinase family protein [Candidatus Hydrogenedentes bacterium]|nr:insulinase family protein [Candidatus Hydrogenedentota bacterium]